MKRNVAGTYCLAEPSRFNEPDLTGDQIREYSSSKYQ
jgi:hypothetical protein